LTRAIQSASKLINWKSKKRQFPWGVTVSGVVTKAAYNQVWSLIVSKKVYKIIAAKCLIAVTRRPKISPSLRVSKLVTVIREPKVTQKGKM
jgi:hypothetical protein